MTATDDAIDKTAQSAEPNGIAAAGPEMMEAVVQDSYGSAPEQVLRLAKVVRPTIGAHEVLLQVRAASVDRGTWHVMAGLPYPIRLAGFGLRRPKGLNPGHAVARPMRACWAEATAKSERCCCHHSSARSLAHSSPQRTRRTSRFSVSSSRPE